MLADGVDGLIVCFLEGRGDSWSWLLFRPEDCFHFPFAGVVGCY